MKKIVLLGMATASLCFSASAGVNAVISGPHTVCMGAPVSYSCAVTHTSSSPRIGMWWTFSNCSTPNWADSTPPLVTFWTVTSMYIQLTVVDTADGTSSTINYPVTVDPRPDLYMSTTSMALDCATNSIELSASSTDTSAEIIWTLPSGLNDTAGSISATSIGSYLVVAVNSYGCSSYTGNRDIIRLPNPVAQIYSMYGGPSLGNIDGSPKADTISFCQGSTPVLSATNYGGGFSWPYSFSWNNGSMDNHINPSTSVAGYELFIVTMTDIRGCSDIDSVYVHVIENPSVNVSPSPSSTYFCAGDTAVFHLPSGDGYTYVWRRNYWTGMGYISDTVSTTDSASFTVNSSLNLMVTNSICISYGSFNVNFTNPPVPHIGVSASLSYDGISDTIKVCSGTSHIISAVYSYPYYTDYALNILWGDGRGNLSFTLDTSGLYTLYVADSITGCHGATSKYIKIYNSPGSEIALSDTGNLCTGESVTLRVVDTTIGNNYSWGYYGNTSDSFIASYSGTYFCNVTNLIGCVTSCTKNLTFHDVPNPTITAGSCEVVVDFANITSVYQWYLLETPIFGATGEHYNTLLTGGGLYKVKEVNSFGCSAFSSCENVVCIDTVESNFVISTHTICNSGNISVTNTSHVSRPVSAICTWNFNGGTPSTFVGWNPPVIYFSGSGSHLVSLEIIDTLNGVSSSYSDIVNVDSINIKVYATSALGTFDTLSSSYICKNNSPRIGVVVRSGLSPFTYSWNYGATIATFSTIISGEQIITVTDAYGCVAQDSINLHVISSPDTATSRVIGNCVGDVTSLAIADTELSCLWSTGSTGRTLNVMTSGEYFVTLTNQFGCISTNNYWVNFNSIPEVIYNVSNSITTYGVYDTTHICNNVSSIVSVASYGSGYSVLWNTGSTDYTTSPMSISGLYFVQITNPQGCVGYDTFYISKHDAPDSFVIQTGRSCLGDTVHLFAIYNPSANYLWSNGDTSRNISVTTGGPFTVEITDEYCSSRSVPHVVIYNMLPTPTIEAYACNLTVSGIAPSSSYQWRTGVVQIIGATNSTYVSTTAGFYSVTEMNINGCVGSSNTIFDTACASVAVDSCDYYPQAKPSIISAGVCKISSDILADSFAWYLDGFAIVNSDSMKVSVTVPGVYAVKCINTHGCSNTSVAVSESCTTGIGELNNNSKIEIYPNPATDNVVVSGIKESFEIMLFNLLGQQVLTKKCDSSDNKFSVKNLTPGVYSLQVVYNGEILNQRFIKE